MPNRTFTLEFKREVVATATLAGAPFAAERHGVDVRTVRDWLTRAGKAPADAIHAADWAELGEAARAQVAGALATGRVSPVAAATIAAIAQRNAAKVEPKEPRTAEEAWADDLEGRIRQLDPTERHDLSLYLRVLIQSDEDAWADDPIAYLGSIGDPAEWIARKQQADHAAMVERLDLNRQAAEASQRRVLDAETQALVEAAETYLKEHAA